MRILYCNKYNYPFSGTEVYLFDLIKRMDDRGQETALFCMDHGRTSSFVGRSYTIPYLDFKDENASLWRKARMAGHALYSFSAREAMRKCIEGFRPDVAHVRGIYHHLSPSILWELKKKKIPVIYHINDFKILCPTYNLVADGRACELCSGGVFRHVMTRGCYTGLRAGAAVLAAEAYLHKWLRTYKECVDVFLAPSEFVRQKLAGAGYPQERIEVMPHYQELPKENQLAADEGYVLYFGRLSREKGVDELLRAMARLRIEATEEPFVPNSPGGNSLLQISSGRTSSDPSSSDQSSPAQISSDQIPLIIAGDGPERGRLETLASELKLSRVRFAGTVYGEKLARLIAGCRFSIFPSHAYETFGKSILESYAWAKPVVATNLGSRREIVEHGATGLLYEDGNREELARYILHMFENPGLTARMGMAGRERVRKNYDPVRHIEKMTELYVRLSTKKVVSISPRPAASMLQRRALRIAFIGGRGVVGKYSGIESYYEQVGHELAKMGHDVTVYCRRYFTPAIDRYKGMRVRRLPTIRSKHMETVVHTLLSTIDAMFSDYDIVHYHCLGPSLFSFLPLLAGKKTVVTVQGLDWQRAKWGGIARRVLQWGEAAAVRLPNATMVVSRTLQQYFRERYRRETEYVPNGASVSVGADGTEARPRLAADRLKDWGLASDNYVLFLGRFSREKNCHLLIEAFERVKSGMKLVLAGGSSHSDDYVEALRKHESERVRFLPWVSGSDLEQLLGNAALFVLPSDIEGLSLALLDAMAAGVCVLTSDIAENSEVVDGVGHTFRCGDRADLERMLYVLMRNPELRRQSAKLAMQRVRREYQWPVIARLIEKVYLRVLGWEQIEEDRSEEKCNKFGSEDRVASIAVGTEPLRD